MPRRAVAYRGMVHQELDLPGVLARRPQLALVDELAHTNADGVEHAEALAGRRVGARRRDRRDQHRQRPAPGVAERPDRRTDRGAGARDAARSGARRRGRRGRDRPAARGAAAAAAGQARYTRRSGSRRRCRTSSGSSSSRRCARPRCGRRPRRSATRRSLSRALGRRAAAEDEAVRAGAGRRRVGDEVPDAVRERILVLVSARRQRAARAAARVAVRASPAGRDRRPARAAARPSGDAPRSTSGSTDSGGWRRRSATELLVVEDDEIDVAAVRGRARAGNDVRLSRGAALAPRAATACWTAATGCRCDCGGGCPASTCGWSATAASGRTVILELVLGFSPRIVLDAVVVVLLVALGAAGGIGLVGWRAAPRATTPHRPGAAGARGTRRLLRGDRRGGPDRSRGERRGGSGDARPDAVPAAARLSAAGVGVGRARPARGCREPPPPGTG